MRVLATEAGGVLASGAATSVCQEMKRSSQKDRTKLLLSLK